MWLNFCHPFFYSPASNTYLVHSFKNAIKMIHFLGQLPSNVMITTTFSLLPFFYLNWVQDTFTCITLPIWSLLLHTGILIFCSCTTNHSTFDIPKLSSYNYTQFYLLHFMQNSFPQATTMPSSIFTSNAYLKDSSTNEVTIKSTTDGKVERFTEI